MFWNYIKKYLMNSQISDHAEAYYIYFFWVFCIIKCEEVVHIP